MVNMADTVVLVTAVGKKKADPGRDFFPLTVNYQEKTYAAGKIPGGFFKREGRPGEKEILTCRLIDRPIRPLFPKGFQNEVQIIATVVSLNPDVDPDIPALIGASAALAISGMPFAGPIAAAKVGYKDGEYVLNPGRAAVAQTAIAAINELAAETGKESWNWEGPATDEELESAVAAAAESGLTDAYQITDKMDRQSKVGDTKSAAMESLAAGDDADGRDHSTVRAIDVEVGLLPRAHGSSLFTRGETQAIVATTLGTGRDAQMIDAIEGERKDPFMFHYNFPPFCVGETGFVGSPKRREIGHGKLARRGIEAVMPGIEEFPYVIRIVSEITESNGSSSMASVCGASLSLMDAGVPIKAPVAGVAMGLVKEGEKFAVLTDILGDEDHLGDMDFKVAGTDQGITALQMDIKIQGITKEIMSTALDQAKDARLHILQEMNKVIDAPREEMSEWAPTIITFKIDPEKIRDVIGKGGSVIRAMTEETGATIDLDNDGTVKIASVDGASGREAKRRIDLITADVEVGRIYDGKVVRLMDFGAFVTILPGKDGLVHISQISNERVEKVSDKLSEGDEVKVKVLEVDRQGRVRLSMKEVDAA